MFATCHGIIASSNSVDVRVHIRENASTSRNATYGTSRTALQYVPTCWGSSAFSQCTFLLCIPNLQHNNPFFKLQQWICPFEIRVTTMIEWEINKSHHFKDNVAWLLMARNGTFQTWVYLSALFGGVPWIAGGPWCNLMIQVEVSTPHYQRSTTCWIILQMLLGARTRHQSSPRLLPRRKFSPTRSQIAELNDDTAHWGILHTGQISEMNTPE